jgi:hypothetical protein
MTDAATSDQAAGPKLLVNAGCGPKENSRLPAMFKDWRQLRVDVEAAVQPDLVASVTDLSAIESGTANAIWSAHCIEHLYWHEVARALAEFHRILADDGFACIIVPDLQTIANYITADRLHEVIYESPAGPVTAHDMLFGFGPALAQGHTSMGHRCGFTPTLLLQRFKDADTPFTEVVLRRRPSLELAAVARKKPSADPAGRDALLAALEI